MLSDLLCFTIDCVKVVVLCFVDLWSMLLCFLIPIGIVFYVFVKAFVLSVMPNYSRFFGFFLFRGKSKVASNPEPLWLGCFSGTRCSAFTLIRYSIKFDDRPITAY